MIALILMGAIIAIVSSQGRQESGMASLVVRNLDQRIVDALKQRAAKHGRSAEAEHRALLEAQLLKPTGKSFAEALKSIPNVGKDEDFERVEDQAGNEHVFS
jgi:plasmid stability protein